MKKLLSLLLCIVLVFTCSGIAFAVNSDSENETLTETYRVTEVPELRELNADTYLLSNGAYECVVYSENKYFRDENGEYKEINNAIIPVEYKSGEAIYKYANKASDTKVFFSKETPSVLIQSEEKELSFSLIGSNVKGICIGEKSNEYAFPDFDLQSEKCITYTGVFEGVDLIYAVNTGYVKEYIVLNSSNAPSEYLFEFDTSSCTITKNDAGTLDVFNSSGELVFEFGSLFAVDSASSYTEALKYEIAEKDKNSTLVKVVLDVSYLKDESRMFPILIDPSIMVTGASKTYDTYVSSKKPTNNYYMYNWLRTGRDDPYGIRRTYIKFNIPSSVSKYISSASIYMKKYSGSDPNVRAYRVATDWNSSDLTWNNKPSYADEYSSKPATSKSNNWCSFDVTRLVSLWQKGVFPNYGFLIRDSVENSTSHWTTFYSSEASSPNKPELRIVYTSYDTTLMAFREIESDGSVSPRNSYFSTVSSYVRNNRKGNTYTSFYPSYTHANMVKRLQSTLIYFVHTHGSQTGVYLGDGYFFTTTSMRGIDLSNLRCALLLTCETGKGGYSSTRVKNNTPINIVERLVICGAETVIGFKTTTYVSECNVFAENFAERTMLKGYSIYNAVKNMDCSNFTVDMSESAVIGGNSSQTLNW